MKQFHYQQSFSLECGEVLPEITIAYHTCGKLNESGDNVIWICHALTANSNVTEWWPGLIGETAAFSPSQYFIVCANILGSCYGSTGPATVNPHTGKPYFLSFPFITIRDMVKAHQLLARHLDIKKIHVLAGGSMGGYQVLEWCLMEPLMIRDIFVIATSARESPWGIAIHTTQRLAVEADCTWGQPSANAAQKGLKAARAIGMLTYRNYTTYALTQADNDPDKTDHFKASSYIDYQGTKLVRRFNAYSYWYLTKAMDSHNIARGRTGTVEEALKRIIQRALILGIRSDILCPVQELQLLAQYIPEASLQIIDSNYGHDGFLVETDAIGSILGNWMGQATGTIAKNR